MTTQTPWDRACDLNGLLKAADALAFDLLPSDEKLDVHAGLVSVLNVALRLSEEVLSDADRAHEARVRADLEAIEKAKASAPAA